MLLMDHRRKVTGNLKMFLISKHFHTSVQFQQPREVKLKQQQSPPFPPTTLPPKKKNYIHFPPSPFLQVFHFFCYTKIE